MIFIKDLTKITDTKYSIGYTHRIPFDLKSGYKINDKIATKEELEQIGKLVEVPTDVDVNKITYYNPVVNTIFNDDSPNFSSLDEAKKVKIQELEDYCTKTKDGGFTSNCLGTPRQFDSSSENRSLIMGLSMKASLIANGATLTDTNIDWKTADEPVCYLWTPPQMITLGVDMSTFLTTTIKRQELLQQYVGTLTTIESVQAVTWDTVIPS